MDQAAIPHSDPFLAALRAQPRTRLLPSNITEALLHLPLHTLDAWRARQEPVPTLTTIENQRGYLAGDLMQFVEQEPTRRRSIGIRHASFQDFLTNGLPDDVWVFGMVVLDFHGMRRPVDLVTCLELPATSLADVHYPHVNWKDYVEAMDHYLSRFRDQQDAEALATERAQRALSLAPGKKKRTNAEQGSVIAMSFGHSIT